MLYLYNMNRFLYVDDDLMMRKVNTAMLKFLYKNNVIVDTAYNGDDGFKMYSSNKYDCVITDILMPHTDGYRLINNIRLNDKETPIVVTSVYHKSFLIEGVLSKGNILYYLKPFLKDDFVSALTHFDLL